MQADYDLQSGGQSVLHARVVLSECLIEELGPGWPLLLCGSGVPAWGSLLESQARRCELCEHVGTQAPGILRARVGFPFPRAEGSWVSVEGAYPSPLARMSEMNHLESLLGHQQLFSEEWTVAGAAVGPWSACGWAI